MPTKRPSLPVLVGRAVTVRCPICGERRIRRRLLGTVDDCPRCELHFEREDGHWVGAVATNTMLAVGALVVAQFVLFALLYPDLTWQPLLIVNLTVGIVAPILFYPVSKMLWTALTLLMEPPRPGEVIDDYLWIGPDLPTRPGRPKPRTR